MSRGCDQCNKSIPVDAGCYFNEDEGSYYCSDACLEAAFDDNPGKGKWRRDKTENEAGGYISVRENNRNPEKWFPLNTFWTTVPENMELFNETTTGKTEGDILRLIEESITEETE